MDSIFKFLKVFNSAQKPWQVTLAIVLGMFSGFMPVSGIQSIFIFFIALVINIPLGIYFFFVAQFALIGYFFDPIFESLGYALLNMDALNGMWTLFYNSGLIRLTHFDNTIVLGSMVFSLIMSYPMYFIVKKTLEIYREKLAAFFAKISFLSKFGLFKVSDKVIKTLRIWGLALFGVLMVLVIVFVLVFMDSLFKWGIESGLETALDKDVKIEALEVDLNNAALNISGLEVTSKDTKRKVFSIDEISTDLDFNALLLNKTHIDHIKLKGMRFNEALPAQTEQNQSQTTSSASSSSRAVSTTSETASASNASSSTQTGSEKKSGIDLPNVDDILAKEDLKSSKLADTAQKEYAQISKKWANVISKEFSPDFRKSFNAELNVIKRQAKDFKKIGDTKKKVDAFTKRVNISQKRIAVLKKEFAEDKKLIEKRINDVKAAKDADFKAMKAKYSFDKGGAINVVGALLGDKYKGYLDTANEYYEKVAPYLESDEDEVTPEQRHKGRWIKFKEDILSPALLIKKVDIDGFYRSQKFQGLVTNITDDQKGLGRTTKFKITSNGKDIKKMLIVGDDNRMGKTPIATVKYSAQKIKDTSFDIAIVAIEKSNMAVQGKLKILDKKIDNKTLLTFTQAKLKTKNIGGKIGKALQEDLKKTRTFTVTVKAKGKLAQPDIDVKTSLEQVINNSMKRMMRAEVKAFEDKLNKKLSKMVGRDLDGIDLNKLSGVDKILGSEDKALNKVENDAKKSAQKAVPKIDTKKFKNFRF